jgi:hypothetical protein
VKLGVFFLITLFYFSPLYSQTPTLKERLQSVDQDIDQYYSVMKAVQLEMHFDDQTYQETELLREDDRRLALDRIAIAVTLADLREDVNNYVGEDLPEIRELFVAVLTKASTPQTAKIDIDELPFEGSFVELRKKYYKVIGFLFQNPVIRVSPVIFRPDLLAVLTCSRVFK